MLTHMLRMLPLLSLLLEVTDPPKPPKLQKPEGVTDEIQTWLNGIVAEAERRATQRGKDDAVAEAEAARVAAEEAATLAANEQAGEYATAKAALEKQITDANTARTAAEEALAAANTTIASLQELVSTGVEEEWKTLPEEIRETYEGADDDLIAKKGHMTKFSKLIAKLAQPGGKTPADPDPLTGKFGEIPSVLSKKQMFQ